MFALRGIAGSVNRRVQVGDWPKTDLNMQETNDGLVSHLDVAPTRINVAPARSTGSA